MKETFDCVTLSRADFEGRGFDTSNIDDTTMAHIAMKIGENLVEQLYWDLIDEYGSNNSMPPTPAAAFQAEIAPIMEVFHDGLPLYNEDGELIFLFDGYIERHVEKGKVVSQTFDSMDAEEIGYIRNLLKKQGYLGGNMQVVEPEEEPEELHESANDDDNSSAEPVESEENNDTQFPITICDNGSGYEEFHTFNNETEMISFFNDNFSAAADGNFEDVSRCMDWIDESSYLSIVKEKTYYVTLYFQHSVTVKTTAFSEEHAIECAEDADFEDAEQTPWEEYRTPSVTEHLY